MRANFAADSAVYNLLREFAGRCAAVGALIFGIVKDIILEACRYEI